MGRPTLIIVNMSVITQNHTHNEIMISCTPSTANSQHYYASFYVLFAKNIHTKAAQWGDFVHLYTKIVRDINEIWY
jgi:hypothetical protein